MTTQPSMMKWIRPVTMSQEDRVRSLYVRYLYLPVCGKGRGEGAEGGRRFWGRGNDGGRCAQRRRYETDLRQTMLR